MCLLCCGHKAKSGAKLSKPRPKGILQRLFQRGSREEPVECIPVPPQMISVNRQRRMGPVEGSRTGRWMMPVHPSWRGQGKGQVTGAHAPPESGAHLIPWQRPFLIVPVSLDSHRDKSMCISHPCIGRVLVAGYNSGLGKECMPARHGETLPHQSQQWSHWGGADTRHPCCCHPARCRSHQS